jgi:hypothetical protein
VEVTVTVDLMVTEATEATAMAMDITITDIAMGIIITG